MRSHGWIEDEVHVVIEDAVVQVVVQPRALTPRARRAWGQACPLPRGWVHHAVREQHEAVAVFPDLEGVQDLGAVAAGERVAEVGGERIAS
jgi:hypothetical protein